MKKPVTYNYYFGGICLQLKGKTKTHGDKYAIYLTPCAFDFFLFNCKRKYNCIKQKHDAF